MLNLIIFSKDRGCQLDALLRSINKFLRMEAAISVLYTYSNNDYKRAYDDLIKMYKHINFVKESNFKMNTLDLMDSRREFTLYLVDDIILTKRIEDDRLIRYFRHDKEVLAIKLVAGKNIQQRFGENDYIKQPDFTDKHFNVWNWKAIRGTPQWGYPMGVATQIYRTNDLRELLPRLNYASPNFMESEMDRHPLDKKLMMCYNTNKLIIIQINRVQQTHKNNRYGNVSLKELNDKWLEGFRISTDPWYNLRDDAFEFLNVGVEYEPRN